MTELDDRTRVAAAAATHADGSWTMIARLVAIAAVMAVATRFDVARGVTIGYCVAFLLVPVWFPVLREYVGTRVLFVVGSLTVVSGVVLTEIAQGDHPTSSNELVSASVTIVGLLASIGVILWSRKVLSVGAIGASFGVGMLVSVSPSGDLFGANPWRFGFSVPVTVLALGLVAMTGKRWLELMTLAVLAIVSGLTDARSGSAILILTVLLVGWQMRPARATRRGSAARVIVAVGGIALIVYNVGEALILEGVLGETTQQRSLEQVNASGSLIVGGRPELAATAALMGDSPFGFGAGTLPSLHDIMVAKTGMASINYDPNNGYVDRYMFGSGFELHSMFGDLWARFGLVGLLFTAVLIFLNLRGVGRRVARNSASALLLYVAIKTLWNVPFSPLYSSLPLAILLMGLVLVRRTGTGSAGNPGPRSANAHV